MNKRSWVSNLLWKLRFYVQYLIYYIHSLSLVRINLFCGNDPDLSTTIKLAKHARDETNLTLLSS